MGDWTPEVRVVYLTGTDADHMGSRLDYGAGQCARIQVEIKDRTFEVDFSWSQMDMEPLTVTITELEGEEHSRMYGRVLEGEQLSTTGYFKFVGKVKPKGEEWEEEEVTAEEVEEYFTDTLLHQQFGKEVYRFKVTPWTEEDESGQEG